MTDRDIILIWGAVFGACAVAALVVLGVVGGLLALWPL